MARLIDADELINQFDDIPPFVGITRSLVNQYIDEAPTVDAVPVVRCLDCKYYFQDEIYGEICRHPELDFEIECYDHWINIKHDDFCSYGKRKDGDGNG